MAEALKSCFLLSLLDQTWVTVSGRPIAVVLHLSHLCLSLECVCYFWRLVQHYWEFTKLLQGLLDQAQLALYFLDIPVSLKEKKKN